MRMRLPLGEDCGPGEGLFGLAFLSHVSLARMSLYTGNVHQPRYKMYDKCLTENVDQISLYHLVSHPRVPRTHRVPARVRIVPWGAPPEGCFPSNSLGFLPIPIPTCILG